MYRECSIVLTAACSLCAHKSVYVCINMKWNDPVGWVVANNELLFYLRWWANVNMKPIQCESLANSMCSKVLITLCRSASGIP